MAGTTKKSIAPQSSGSRSQGYTVLARRYRSRDFDELIGQEPIARTLQNAIKTNRTAHAYLFCGTRGVGKTSMARIFAKALNATDNLKEQDAIAEAILRGDDLDVIEIDGASNRGIDEARNLIAGAGLSPARSPYKIYIIDEVHMLTTPAFNALLKTMEEPPEHVKFILCTTEPHKVPATIQSRCQRFDFRPIPSAKIAQQLRRILDDEGIKADDEVIAHVARLGNGSMRDALSLLDRLLAAGEPKLTIKLVEDMLGLPDHARVSQLVDAIAASDARAALKSGAELLNTGASVEQVLELLAEHFRTLMVLAACGDDAEFLDLTEEHREAALAQAARFDAPGLVHMIAVCDAVSRNARYSAASRALFDAAIVRLAMSEHLADIPRLLAGGSIGGGAPITETKPARAAIAVSPDAKKKEAQLSPDEASSGRSGPGDPSHPRIPTASSSVMEVKKLVADVEPPPAGRAFWDRVLAVAAGSVVDRARTKDLVFESFDGQTLRLSLPEQGVDSTRFVTQTDQLAELVRRATGHAVRIELDAGKAVEPVRSAIAASDSGRHPPLVRAAIDLFGASVVSVNETPLAGGSEHV
jgi:DNA polymerase-3 subunit gamma/tau